MRVFASASACPLVALGARDFEKGNIGVTAIPWSDEVARADAVNPSVVKAFKGNGARE
jgi:hypothetical protein